MINQITLNPPAYHQTGDTYVTDGGYLNQVRNGNIVRTWNIKAMQKQRLNNVVVSGSIVETLYLEQSMPGQTVSIVNTRRGSQNQAIFTFSNGNVREADWETIAANADNIDGNSVLCEDLLMARAVRMDPSGANITNQDGGAFTINLLADNPVVYTPPSE
jgi:hypothetical protein